MTLVSLPVDAIVPDLLAALAAHSGAVVCAPTGSGKTTRVPPALLAAPWLADRQVIMLEPRRVAARGAATRIADELGEAPGNTVGWQIRFERCGSSTTRLWVVTEGVLLRHLQADPFLDGVGAVVLDEVHERSLDADLALAMLLRVQREVRPDLRLVAMSATLDAERLGTHMGDVPVLRSEGRLYPVSVEHLPPGARRELSDEILWGVRRALDAGPGDILVFLPGLREILRVAELLHGSGMTRDMDVIPLYGDLPPHQQQAALQPGPRRRVVLATNVAETSVTLPGVTAVIDSGLVRRLHHDPGLGLDRLETERVSRASAEQRRGRAGRVRPGWCLRLWTELDHGRLNAREEPEILRRDLAGPVLQLMAWGEREVTALPWLDPPPEHRVEAARELLTRLGALDGDVVTARGHAMASLPLHPRIAAMLLDAGERGALREASLAAALLDERDIPELQGGRGPTDSDIADLVEAFSGLIQRGAHGARAARAARVAKELEERVQRLMRDRAMTQRDPPRPRSGGSSRQASDAPTSEPTRREALCRALLAGWPDRVVLARHGDARRGRMVGGHGVVLHPQSRLRDVWLWIALDVAGATRGQVESQVRVASLLRRSWLEERGLKRDLVVRYDAERERVVATEQVRYADLILEERPAPVPPDADPAELLAPVLCADPWSFLALSEEPARTWLRRAALLRELQPALDLPDLSVSGLKRMAAELCSGCKSRAQVREGFVARVQGLLSWPQRQALDRFLPEGLAVPSGRTLPLAYPDEGGPVLAVKIQELFGLSETPRVAEGALPVRLHLLAPNGRPQQVTEDLSSFWRNTWPTVRKELRARYPKHPWPEDPSSAEATWKTTRALARGGGV